MVTRAIDTPATPRTYPVMEIFGPVFQGEGVMIGKQTKFIRFGLCDYRCSWCDSPHAVEPALVQANAIRMSPGELISEIGTPRFVGDWLTFSGGNPALHELRPVVRELRTQGWSIQVETQGTIWRPWLNECQQITVSPKPPSSQMNTNWTQLRLFLDNTKADKCLKVVVFDDDDFDYARNVHVAYPDIPFFLSVGNPDYWHADVNANYLRAMLLERLEWLSQKAINDPLMGDVVTLPQLHVLVYLNKRGV